MGSVSRSRLSGGDRWRGGLGGKDGGGGVGVRGLCGATLRVARSFKSLLNGLSQLGRG